MYPTDWVVFWIFWAYGWLLFGAILWFTGVGG
jgi:hypothetical protein